MTKKPGAKISKTAARSVNAKKVKQNYVKACSDCGYPMVATKVITKPRGMYWVCAHCDHREKI